MGITKAQQARLGIFMTGGIILVALFIIIPLGFKLSNRQKTYYTYFEGESVSGLEQGASVKFKGIPIGKVSQITYDPDNLSRVKVKFRVQHDFPMKKDMYIQTGMMGITGLKYVEILGGSNRAKAVEGGSTIPSRPSAIATITGKADVLVGKIELLLNHLTTITNPDSLAAIKQILDNVASISGKTNLFMDDLTPEVRSIARSTAQTMDQVVAIAEDVRMVLAEFNRSTGAGRLTAILTSVDSTARSLKQMSENMNMTILQTREDFTVSMQNLRETIENANELSQQLVENPSLLLSSEPRSERER